MDLYSRISRHGVNVAGMTHGDERRWLTVSVYHVPSEGTWWLMEHGSPGGELGVALNSPKKISRAEAIDWIAKHATESVTGYRITSAEAEQLVADAEATGSPC